MWLRAEPTWLHVIVLNAKANDVNVQDEEDYGQSELHLTKKCTSTQKLVQLYSYMDTAESCNNLLTLPLVTTKLKEDHHAFYQAINKVVTCFASPAGQQ